MRMLNYLTHQNERAVSLESWYGQFLQSDMEYQLSQVKLIRKEFETLNNYC
jgi:hypothetical protein